MTALTALAACSLALCALAAHAPAQEPADRVLLDRDLQPIETTELRLDGERIHYTDPDGNEHTLPTSSLAAVVPGWWTYPDRTRTLATGEGGTVELTDGQRLPGTLIAAHDERTDTLLWEHPLFGRLEIPLDAVAYVNLGHSPQPPTHEPTHDGPLTGDTVVLLNGDVITGFVESIRAAVSITTDGETLDIPASNVATVTLANPAARPDGTVVWLEDGTVAALQRIESTDETGRLMLTLAPGLSPTSPPTASLEPDRIVAVSFRAGNLLPLASLPLASVEPRAPRIWADPPAVGRPALAPLGAAEIEIRGPASAEWKLPHGAARIAGYASLPEDAHDWGDFDLVLSAVDADGKPHELLRRRLHRDDPWWRFDADLDRIPDPDRLRVTIETGRYGPVHNRARLECVLLLRR